MQSLTPLDTHDTRRWLANFSGKFFSLNGCTRLGKTQHFGPLRVQRPFFPEGNDCLHFYLLHPPGGLVGGDSLSIKLDLDAGAHVMMTTPSAGKMYRNISNLSQGQFVQLSVADGAALEYLPQENIIFDGAEGELHTRVDLAGSGVFAGWEITCLGRYESNDPFEAGSLKQSLEVYRDGKPLFLDRLILRAPSALQQGLAGFQDHCVFGTFVISADLMNDETFAESLIEWQEALNGSNGDVTVAMTQKPNVWIARAIGDKAEKVRDAYEALWVKIRPHLLTREACPPRIWRT